MSGWLLHVGSHLEAWRRTCDGVGILFDDSVGDVFRIQGTLDQHGYHNILQ